MRESAFNSLMYIADRPPIVFVEGSGSWLVDRDGRRYLDFIQGWAVNCLGHCSRVVTEALVDQAGRLINASPAFYNRPMGQLAERLAAESALDKVFFANSGAEANEGAIKLARKWGAKHRGGAYEIITMENGFHGRTLATMSASDKPAWRHLYEPKVPGFPKVPFNDAGAVAAAINEKTVAILLEPIQGESGVIPAEDAYLRALRRLTEERGILLMVDEIQTGMGRTGRLFAHQHAGIRPDVMTLGKGLGGGVPLAALLARAEVCCFEAGDQGGTYNGNPLMTAVGYAVVEELTKPGFLDRVVEAGEHMRSGLDGLRRKYGFPLVRGRGLLYAMDLGRDIAQEIVERARKAGLLLNAPRPGVLRFMPALTVTDAEIDRMLDILDSVLAGP